MLKQSTARNLMVFLTDSTDHLTGLTGATLTVTLSKNGAAFGSITPTVTERGTGWYSLAMTASHTDTLGDLVLHITAASADPIDLREQVVVGLPGESVTVSSIGTDVITSTALASSAVTEIAAGVRTELTTELGRIDVATSTRLATSGYTVPPTASTNATAVRSELATELGRIDVATSTRLASSGYTAAPTASDNATAVLLAAEVAPIRADIRKVNNYTVKGAGTESDPWNPA